MIATSTVSRANTAFSSTSSYLRKKDSEPGEYICRVRPRSQNYYYAARSVSCEVDLEPGTYEVLPKVTAKKVDRPPVEHIVSIMAEAKPQKLRQVGLSYDLAHAKALKEEILLARRQRRPRRLRKPPTTQP